ncbi:MAG: glucose-1-phosphate adenylyltransferase [Clostridia bacterium]|nr:glucose-1-phosphate adenylyltransferase [Clostridia bacterium]MBR6754937.1 glucose-1-phosphate adenylyltransferase [Clostridia bacterium]
MITKKETVAMLLAGGQGSRLHLLTERIAKPAVPFGGKYRIIDFPLSNCVNSGIDTVGVLTQYQPLALNEYIGNGQPWDLDRTYGGVTTLPPYQAQKRADWYKGTANAIYQNMRFIDKYDPDYVVILSGDHIYKMDYAEMLEAHKKNEADCTIAVFDVPLAEASRFGIMATDAEMRITEFAEKPKEPKSTKASMGVYIFSKDKLFKYLEADEADENSAKDFGKNIIPAMLNAGERLYAFEFEGYWKDVGTIDSLWESNMDLLGDRPALNLKDREWRIHSRNDALPPHYVGQGAVINNSIITEGCEIYGTVINSVLSAGVVVERGAVVRDSVILGNVVLRADSTVDYSVIDADTVVGKGASVGKEIALSKGITLVGGGLTVPEGVSVPDGVLCDDNMLKELSANKGVM